MNRFTLKSSRWILSAAIVCSIVGVASSAQALVLKKGSTGYNVRILQDTLKSKGFMSSSVSSTGYYGSITRQAVMNFQRDRGLRIDGVVGPQTLRAMELAGTGGSIDSSPSGTKGIVRVRGYLNVRSGPGAGYSVQRTLSSGDGIFIFGQSNNGWYKISDSNEWVYSGYIERSN